MKVSVIVVTLNSGDDLIKTIENIERQTSNDYEIIIKDGGSSDGSIDKIKVCNYPNIHIYEEKDKGIYDAMNKAVKYATGDYVIFINAGDFFHTDDVIEKFVRLALPGHDMIAYGDTYFELSKSLSKAPSVITGSVCYRNIPCHQAIFYSRDVLASRGFDTSFKIRADYEQFIWCYYNKRCDFKYLDFPVCTYQGGGFSESAVNKKRDREEYSRAVKLHIPVTERFKYRLFLILTLHKVRGMLARNEKTATYYQKFKTMFQK